MGRVMRGLQFLVCQLGGASVQLLWFHAIFLIMKTDQEAMIFIQQPLEVLPLSGEFIEQSRQMGFSTLKEIIDTGGAKVVKKKRFTYRWFGELLNFLESEQLLHLFPTKPSNTAR